MKKELTIKLKVKWLISALVLVLSLLLVWKMLQQKKGRDLSKKEEPVKIEERKIFIPKEVLQNHTLSTTKLTERGLNEELTLPGKVSYDLENMAEVSPRISGKINHVYVKEGDTVRTGSALASITSVQVGEQAEKYLKAKARLETVKTQAERARELFQQKIISAKDYELAAMEYKTVKAEVSTGINTLMIYGFSQGEIRLLEEGKMQYKNLLIRSPLSGTVTFRSAIVGQSINPEDKLFTIANLSRLWIILDVYEKDLSSVKVGARALIYPISDTSEPVKAKVAHVGEVIDSNTHTAKIRLEVNNKNYNLKPGQSVSAKVVGLISSSGSKTIKVLPSKAVQKSEGKNLVFVKTADGAFIGKEVEIGKIVDEDIEILSGITSEDEVVVEGAFMIKSEYLK
ncbi:MAG: efflux RND transporter periplasmic adaptor subunit [Leptospiraceae bacterium]|nr:efflux RND transporter periplasmic adaptor subunit [Leptospiraceae bacterium]MCP5502128.1 efflux RND transporter periplasmic adaptor subunit [Leptospiraceae bacterium]